MNILIISGRTTKDIELKTTQNGRNIATFTVAVKREFKNSDGIYESDFIICTAYGKTADNISRFVHKGDYVEITGSIKINSYEKDGKKQYNVIVDKFNKVIKNKKDSSSDEFEMIDDDELPFDYEWNFKI